MKSKLLYALMATSIAAASSMTASALVLTWVPKGKPRALAERWLVAPGQAVFERLHGQKEVRKLLKEGEAEMKAGEKKLGRLPHLYNVGAWTGAAFVLCLLMTLLFGISSLKDALVLGVKVTFTLAFLQAALILAGVLVLHGLP